MYMYVCVCVCGSLSVRQCIWGSQLARYLPEAPPPRRLSRFAGPMSYGRAGAKVRLKVILETRSVLSYESFTYMFIYTSP